MEHFLIGEIPQQQDFTNGFAEHKFNTVSIQLHLIQKRN